MTWNGLTAGGHKAAAAQVYQTSADAQQAAARAKNAAPAEQPHPQHRLQSRATVAMSNT